MTDGEGFELRMFHVYIILAIVSMVLFFFYSDVKMTLPMYGTLCMMGLLLLIALSESWQRWAKSGALVLTTLGVGRGHADGFNATCDNITATERNKPSFTCLAQGGFVYAGFSTNGSKRFIVCPPEHVQEMGGNVFVKTKLRKVQYRELPPYIQQTLLALPGFNVEKVIKKKNLYFGMCSPYYGTDSAENVKIEENILASMSMQNEYKSLYEELLEKKRKAEPQPKLIRLVSDEEQEEQQ